MVRALSQVFFFCVLFSRCQVLTINLKGLFRVGMYSLFWEAVRVLSLVGEGYLCVDRLNPMASLIR